MKKILIAALAVIVITALAITCPDREKHVEAIESVFDYVAQRSAQEPGSLFDGQYLDALFLSRIASAVIDPFLKVDKVCYVTEKGAKELPSIHYIVEEKGFDNWEIVEGYLTPG